LGERVDAMYILRIKGAFVLAVLLAGCGGGENKKDTATLPWGLQDKAEPTDRANRSGPDKADPGKPGNSELTQVNSFLGISLDFKTLATADKGVRLVDRQTGQQILQIAWDRQWGAPKPAAFSTENIAVVENQGLGSGGVVKVFSRMTGEYTQNIRGRISDAAFSQDGRYLAVVEFRSANGFHLIFRDVTAKKTIAEIRMGRNGTPSLSVAGKYAAVYESDEDQITVAEIDTGKVVKRFKNSPFRKWKQFRGMKIALSPKANLLACESEDIILLYDFETEKVRHTLEGHLDVVETIAFHPAGEILASSRKDKTIRFWNVKEGKEIHTVKNLPAAPSKLIFSEDGKRIAVVYGGKEWSDVKKAEIVNVDLK
jgi:WD40 repeat protein